MTRGLEQLEPLLGRWTSTSKTYSEARGRMTVARTEDGKFLRIDTQIEDPRFPQATQLIGSDDSRDECTALYYDSRGVYRVYYTTLRGADWRMWREAPKFNQRYIGKVSEDGRKITGQWEFSEDGKTWKVDFNLDYTKAVD